jgi:hypothetical protein
LRCTIRREGNEELFGGRLEDHYCIRSREELLQFISRAGIIHE